jgi:hypothetical protein
MLLKIYILKLGSLQSKTQVYFYCCSLLEVEEKTGELLQLNRMGQLH